MKNLRDYRPGDEVKVTRSGVVEAVDPLGFLMVAFRKPTDPPSLKGHKEIVYDPRDIEAVE